MKRIASSLMAGFMAGFILAVCLLFGTDLIPGVTWVALKKVLVFAGLGCYLVSWAAALFVYRIRNNA